MSNKYQVFISSTYTDLKEERQAAVKAVLNAGHIPAGMELFKAGKEQLETIYKWIDESDIYLLILGGRYGSIEPISQKSYTQLEYEYALKKGMPIFSIVMSDDELNRRIKSPNVLPSDVMEVENNPKYQEFKRKVKGLICHFFSDAKDIETSIAHQIPAFEKDQDIKLVGWVSGKEVERLKAENKRLLSQDYGSENQKNTNPEVDSKHLENILYDVIAYLDERTLAPNKYKIEKFIDNDWGNLQEFCFGIIKRIFPLVHRISLLRLLNTQMTIGLGNMKLK